MLEISKESVSFEADDDDSGTRVARLRKSDIILIEYYGGVVEVFSEPKRDITFTPNKAEARRINEINQQHEPRNFGSINTLALCNADVAGFYEHIGPKKYFGIGAMAAFNFNPQANLANGFIVVLHNAKKEYDAGVFLHFYPTHFKRKNTFYYGLLFKYTEISFTRVEETRSGNVSNLTYSPASGSQRATIFTIGSHYKISNTIFVKSIVGMGGFNLRGIYQEQYNYSVHGTSGYGARFLLKLYFGLNVGYTF